MIKYLWLHLLKIIHNRKFIIFFFIMLVFFALTSSVSAFKNNNKFLVSTRDGILFISSPFITGFEYCSNYIKNTKDNINEIFRAKAENSELKARNTLLEGYFIKYKILEQENIDLKSKLAYIADKEIKYKTAKLIGNVINESLKEAYINAGTNAGLIKDSLVFNETGAVGRIIFTSDNYSKVLLLNDRRSNIPVRGINSGVKMILSGTNNDELFIKFLAQDKPIEIGELLVTSGEEKLLPDNIAVGKIIGHNGEHYIVKTFNNLANLNTVYIYSNEN